MTKTFPIIGIPLDSEKPGGYSKMPWYAMRQNYCDSIQKAGGIPILLPHHLELTAHYTHIIDGVLLTGGDFDIDPTLFGDQTVHETIKTKPARTSFEWEIAKQMLQKNKPILGICGGMQLINVVLGGTLIQHIPDEINNCLQHTQSHPASEAGHFVDIKEETLLHRIAGVSTAPVNTSHHQAIKALAPHIIVNAIAEDGVIEGIESIKHQFCLGVQWHPEYHVSETDKQIFHHFIQSC